MDRFDRIMVAVMLGSMLAIMCSGIKLLELKIEAMPPKALKQYYLITNDNCAMKLFEEGNKEPDDVD